MENEKLIIESKTFMDLNKKEIGESIRKGKKLVFLDFNKIDMNSQILKEALIKNPYKTIEIIKQGLEETGLIKDPEIGLLNIPENYKKIVSNLNIKDLGGLLDVRGRILKRGKIKHKIVRVKFECPSCGAIISVLQIKDKISEPSRCTCGRTSHFNFLSKFIEDFLKITLQDERTDDIIEAEFKGEFVEEFEAESWDECMKTINNKFFNYVKQN